MSDGPEGLDESSRFKRKLPVVLMDVRSAVLRASLRRSVRLVDSHGSPMQIEDASERTATEVRADNCYGGGYWVSDVFIGQNLLLST